MKEGSVHLFNAAVAVVSAVVGTVGAGVAYDTLNAPPVDRPLPLVNPETIVEYLPCEPPATLKDGLCVTTVVRTIVVTPARQITTVQETRSGKGGSGSSGRSVSRHHDDDDDDDEEDDDDREEEEDDD